MALENKPDVIVVGSGAGGAAAAWRLTSKGARVLLLEAGPRFDPATDYPLDKAGWENNGFPEKPGSTATITYGDLGILTQDFADLRRWSKAGSKAAAPIGSMRSSFGAGYSHVQGLGGSTLHFVGEAHRFHEDAFSLRTKTGSGADWPIGYSDLVQYYDVCETLTGVASAGPGAGRVSNTEHLLPAHPVSPGAIALQNAAEFSGHNWEINPRAALSVPYNYRPPCNYCGQCSRGCPLGDKGSTDVTFIPAALETGLLEIITDATVTKLEMGANGRITYLSFVADGKTTRIETPKLVLAAGAVQTPRLLLLSKNAEQPNGLSNGSGELGQNFMETLSVLVSGIVPGLRNSHMGLPADIVDWTHSAPTANTGGMGGYRLGHATLDSGLTGPISYATRLIPGHGKGLRSELREKFGAALAVGGVGQVIPDARSKVTLDPQTKDAFGLPVARISSVLTHESLLLLRKMKLDATKALTATGADISEFRSSWDRFEATHAFGTARMGRDPKRSVVDQNCKSHDHPNLWLADASVFLTSGGGEAPALTIMALATRTADAVLSD